MVLSHRLRGSYPVDTDATPAWAVDIDAARSEVALTDIRHASQTNFVYYTNSAQKLVMRVAVDPVTHAPAGEPELVADGIHGCDDFCMDENAGVSYLTTHVENTLLRVPLDPATSCVARSIVAGDPSTEQLVGPSSAAWARGTADYGRVAYVTTDGGHTAAEYHRSGTDEIVRPAQVLRVGFEADESTP